MSGNERTEERRLVVVGAGGHAASVANVGLSAGYEIKGFVGKGKGGGRLFDVPIVEEVEDLGGDLDAYVYAFAVGDNAVRERVVKELKSRCKGIECPALVHQSAVVSSFALIGEGTVVMPKAVIGPNAKIGRFCLLNTAASIDHDGVMQDFSSLAPGAITGGSVVVGTRSAVSIGALVRHGIKIGDDSVVGAGSYVDKDVPNNVVVYGTPARRIRNRNVGDGYF